MTQHTKDVVAESRAPIVDVADGVAYREAEGGSTVDLGGTLEYS